MDTFGFRLLTVFSLSVSFSFFFSLISFFTHVFILPIILSEQISVSAPSSQNSAEFGAAMAAVALSVTQPAMPLDEVLIHSFIHSVIHSFINSSIFIHSLARAFMHSFIHSVIHSFVHSFLHSCIHSFIHCELNLKKIFYDHFLV